MIASLLWSLVPGLLWLVLLNRVQDRTESPFRVALAFVLGALAVTPAGLLADHLRFDLPRATSAGATVLAAIGVAAIEEGAKLLMVLAVGYRAVRRRLEGIVFACSAGLGFATLETALYVSHYGERVLIIRAFTAVFAHAAFTGIAGYWIGRARESRGDSAWLLLKGIALAVLLHGAYDALLTLTTTSPTLELTLRCLVLALLGIAITWLIGKLRRAIDDARIQRLLKP